ncbi:MAG: GNAT family N-acetyltransferase [Candidatus Marinimicrobia bacterium]|nr:GNAT family N-acetyltransferase [Candidatus Neomarinimicrobiota bacterium]
MNKVIKIRKSTNNDFDQIWEIIKQVIATGDTYVFAPDSSQAKMLDYWCGDDKNTYVAFMDKKIVGTFIIKDNQPDLGSHVANASFMTLPSATRQGIGTAMGKYALTEAKRLGYSAMQFNLVVKSNGGAIRLWEKLGFKIIGETPEAFNHSQNGLTNAYIMWCRL